MQRGLYIAATGMISAMNRQDVIASNLANVDTVGFKGDRVVNESFGDTLMLRLNEGQRTPIGIMNFGTRVAGTVTDFGQGSFRNTGKALDLALSGDGFFKVQMSDGQFAYTRNGQFSRTADGFLTTQTGEHVVGPNNLPVYVGREGDPKIHADGLVTTKTGSQLGQLAIVTLDVPSARKIGQNMWLGAETGGLPDGTQLRQSMVEASSVNSVKEMVEMINTMRTYESSQRVIQSIDGTLDKAVNSLGSLG